MSRIEETIEVAVPVRTAYDQWTQFEEFPRFMEGVEEVRQIDDAHIHWRASVGGATKEWDAEITEQVPDRIVAWRAVEGFENAGSVRFREAGDGTEITLVMAFEPEGIGEKAGVAVGQASRRIRGDLERFRDMIESRGAETGAWRGRIQGGEVSDEHGMETGRGAITETGGTADDPRRGPER